ncbi:MAG: cell division ATP-binding protein FtsE [bacterium]
MESLSASLSGIVQMFHVSKTFDGNCSALVDINLRLEPGEMVYLVGPSGAGKTTLMRLIFREERVSSGQILVQGRNLNTMKDSQVYQLRRRIGVVFQDFKLIHSKTVFENVAYVLQVLGKSRSEIERRVWNSLKRVGLGHKKDQYPRRLSGGEQQRVSIARAIVNDPVLLLADEPTGNLDTDMARDIMELFMDINIQGTAVLMATHNMRIVEEMKRRVIYLREGKIVHL